MTTRGTLLDAALSILEQAGAEGFSTRSVCAIAKVTAPTLYHHFGSADGLLSAALAEAFQQFLARKKAATRSADPLMTLREGWDDYVRFAAERPRLYAAMLARVISGADIPAAREAFALLQQRIAELAAAGRLAMPAADAAQLAWASANAASLLYVPMAHQAADPGEDAVTSLRDKALQAICKDPSQGDER